jgi:hypothetical protein
MSECKPLNVLPDRVLQADCRSLNHIYKDHMVCHDIWTLKRNI